MLLLSLGCCSFKSDSFQAIRFSLFTVTALSFGLNVRLAGGRPFLHTMLLVKSQTHRTSVFFMCGELTMKKGARDKYCQDIRLILDRQGVGFRPASGVHLPKGQCFTLCRLVVGTLGHISHQTTKEKIPSLFQYPLMRRESGSAERPIDRRRP